MGLSNALSGGIVMIVLVYVLLTALVMIDSSISIQDASTDSAEIETSISKTDISAHSLSALAGQNSVDFTIDNNGEEKLWNFENFNLIITFDGETSGRLTESLSYSGFCSGVPSQGTWCINSISNDILDPEIVNDGESMSILSTVSEGILNGGIVIVVMSTDNGVVASLSGTVS